MHGAVVIVCVVGSLAPCVAAPPLAHGSIALFDGQTMQGWQTVTGEPPPPGWHVTGPWLHLSPSAQGPGPLVTTAEFHNFRLDFGWRIAQQGNQGIKYRVRDYSGQMLGLEYQIIDDHHFPEPLRETQKTGALYDLYAPAADRILHPAPAFNYGSIVVCGNKIEHWLNGARILQVEVGSADWHARLAASKFQDKPNFGEPSGGRIMLTDHHSEIWFSHIRLTPGESQTPQDIPETHHGTHRCPRTRDAVRCFCRRSQSLARPWRRHLFDRLSNAR